jgi:hypothetical protein
VEGQDILFRNVTITDSRPTGTLGINSRALVRYAINRHAGRSSITAWRILHGQRSGSREELPERSAGGNKHVGHDGAQIEEDEEEEGTKQR